MFNHNQFRGQEETAVERGVAYVGNFPEDAPFWTPVGSFAGGYRYYEGFTKDEYEKTRRNIQVWVARTEIRGNESFDYHFVKDEETGAFVYEVRNTPDSSPELTAGNYLDTLPERLVRREALPASVELPNSANEARDLAGIVALYGLNSRLESEDR